MTDECHNRIDAAIRKDLDVDLTLGWDAQYGQAHVVGKPLHITTRSVWIVVDVDGQTVDRFIGLRSILAVTLVDPQPERILLP